MRVLLVVHGFPPQAHGGTELYAAAQARALAAAGDAVFVLAREDDRSRPDATVRLETRDGLRIAWINNGYRASRTFEESYRQPAIADVTARLVDEWRPQVAHLHHLTHLSTDLVARLQERGVPIVWTLHDYWLLCHRGQLLDTASRVCAGPGESGCASCLGPAAGMPIPGALVPGLRALRSRLPAAMADGAQRLALVLAPASLAGARDEALSRHRHMQALLRQTDVFLAPSQALRDTFVRHGVDAARVQFWPYGIDPAPFATPRTTARRPLRLGFAGTLMVSKGVDVLVDAFGRLPSGLATLELVGDHADYHGDATYRARLESRLSRPGVRWRGARSHNAMAGFLASIDVLIVPSIWPENSPFVVHEARASGLPVVASRIGGLPELVTDGRNGLLVEPGSVDDLHRALARLLDEPRLLDTLRAGMAARDVRTLDDDVTATRALHASLAVDRAGASAQPRRLAAVVVNHRTQADTTLAVAALLASERPLDEVVLVDNDTVDECRRLAARWPDRVTYFHTGENLGFAAGANRGAGEALARGADAVLIVNPDALVAPSCVGLLEAVLARAPAVGIVAPLLLSRATPDVIASAGLDYDRRSGRMRERHAGLRHADVDASGGTRTAVSGCVMLLTRDAFERTGGFDARYFFGFEDIDLCLRAGDLGVGVWLEAPARAYHEGGRALGPAAPRRFYFAARNHLMVAGTHGDEHSPGGPKARRSLRRFVSVVALNVAHAVTEPGGSRLARLAATARGVTDYVRGRTGG